METIGARPSDELRAILTDLKMLAEKPLSAATAPPKAVLHI